MNSKQIPKGVITALTPDQAEAGRKHYLETMTPENRIVRDDTITAFAVGMKLAGFNHVQRNGCDVLRDCRTCKKPYQTLMTKGGKMFWACPFCNSLESDS